MEEERYDALMAAITELGSQVREVAASLGTGFVEIEGRLDILEGNIKIIGAQLSRHLGDHGGRAA